MCTSLRTGRSQVHRHVPQRPRESAREQGGPDPVPGLPARRVGQAHHCKARQPVGDVHLDEDGTTSNTEQAGRWDGGDHGRAPGRAAVCLRNARGVARSIVLRTARYRWGVSHISMPVQGRLPATDAGRLLASRSFWRVVRSAVATRVTPIPSSADYGVESLGSTP
jgi:hypothetical protein